MRQIRCSFDHNEVERIAVEVDDFREEALSAMIEMIDDQLEGDLEDWLSEHEE